MISDKVEFVPKGWPLRISLNTAQVKRLWDESVKLWKALHEISKGEGPFSRDPLTHASNTIESMKQIAKDAIKDAIVSESIAKYEIYQSKPAGEGE